MSTWSTVIKKPYRTTPTIRLLDSRSASGSSGSAMSPHSCAISAVSTERRGSFLKDDFAPKVAASLEPYAQRRMWG